ncbi:ATP phosphoribosyltransferase [bacterium]|jgi:ATP phosphoribosyltransferase|nr:ATP phosphoribosyltransferase [Verrucomicrobiales bacterium]MDB2346597.1 ATP phosphoribosyltransferase [Verrucomicrobiales bacterium]MDC3255475.1 ATP phosphoribosyltransferase [bacterium]MDF1788705.1 ATP phosphoribosyltransferase [Verrucomicrobiales bacterium]
MSADERILKLGLPKGSLEKPTFDLFEKAGYDIQGASRSYRPQIDDSELRARLLRAQEIGRYVHQGFLDCGITGKDWVAENEADVEVLCDLPYSRATSNPTRWVLVVPEDSPIKDVKDLQGKLIATEALNLTRNFLKEHGVEAKLEFSWGATEVKVPDLVDAIVDITETGSSLRANKLRIVATLMESFPQFVANRKAAADPWKRAKMERIVLLLKAALEARDKVGLKMNVSEKQLQSVLDTLPSLRLPTVNHLSQDGWLAIETILEEKVVREIIPDLKAAGAEGIIEYPLNKVVY